MVELQLNETTGKYEVPGKPQFGRVYQIVNLQTGELGYNCTTSDKPDLDPSTVKMIEEYDTFQKWVTEIISVAETNREVKRLNKAPAEFIETEHTKLVKRVSFRINQWRADDLNGHSVLSDMDAMRDIILGYEQGRAVRPPVEGWKRK